MPHDRNGNLIKVGDTVRVDFTVASVYDSDDFCNASLETVLPMYPGEHKTALTVNTRQTELVASAEEPAAVESTAPEETPAAT